MGPEVDTKQTLSVDDDTVLTVELIKKKAIKGVAALTGRTVILQAISLVATFLLTIFLSPADYGAFFIASAVISFFAYFSDIGLAAALIQKKEKPTEEELRTTFTVQQLLVVFLIILVFLSTPLLEKFYKLEQNSIYLLWALAFSLFLSSLKTIPSVLLERKLDFKRLIIPQIVETILFNVVAVYLAWKGFGITSFTIGVLVRGVSGLVIMYIISPWSIGFAFSRESLKSLFKFGLPYQMNSFLAVFKDDGLTAFLGGILGVSGVGLLGWAQKWAYAPLRFFMDQVIKVTFPAFSRMQNDKQALGKAVSTSVFLICLVVFPTLVILIISAPLLTEIIPKYQKWQPALFALTVISINSAWAAITTPLTNTLTAIGKVMVTFWLMTMWTFLTWIIVPILSYLYGINGAAIGYALVGTSSVVAIIIVKKYVDFSLLKSVGRPVILSLVLTIVLLFLKQVTPTSLEGVIGLIFSGIILYTFLVYLVLGKEIISLIKRMH